MKLIEKLLPIAAILLYVCVPSMAETIIRGKIIDARTGEEIIGAAVILKELAGKGTVSGLDGSFTLNTDLEHGHPRRQAHRRGGQDL